MFHPNLVLRSDQKQALRKTTVGLKRTDRGQIHAPCGWGKSAIQPLIMHRLKARTTVVFVPSLRLITQTARFWIKNAPFTFDLLMVCSRADARLDEDIPNFEGFDVTTDPEEVQAFLRKRGKRVVFCTYQSAYNLQECQRFGLGIFDEAHHTAGSTDKAWSIGLDDQTIAIKKRLFMTATPRIVDVDDSVYSMEDEENYGKVLYEMSFMEAVEKKIIVPYQVIVIASAPAKAAILLPDKGKDNKYDMRTECGVQLLRQARRKYGFKRTISFHSRVSRATAAATRGQELSQSIAWHVVSAKSPKRDRVKGERILSNLRGGVVTNVRCLAEGIDIRDVDSVAFLDPRQSVVDIIQAIGRAMRTPDKHPKEKAYIVIPIIAEGDDVEDMKGAFRNLGRIINAMIAIDETIVDYLRELAIGGNSRKAHNPLIIDVPGGVNTNLARAITAKVLKTSGADWWMSLEKVRLFIKNHGCPPTRRSSVSEVSSLAAWMQSQRRKYKGGIKHNPLTPEKIKALESTPGWSWDFLQDHLNKNDARALRLIKYFDVHQKWPRAKERLGKFRLKLISKLGVGEVNSDLMQQLTKRGCYKNQNNITSRIKLEALLKCIQKNGGVSPPKSTEEGRTQTRVRLGHYDARFGSLVKKIKAATKMSGNEARRKNRSRIWAETSFPRFSAFLKQTRSLPAWNRDRKIYYAMWASKRRWALATVFYADNIKRLEGLCAKYVKGYVYGETMFDRKTLKAAGVPTDIGKGKTQ